MKRTNLQKNLCLRYCSFYKPGKDNSPSCKGFTVIDELLKSGMSLKFKQLVKKSSKMTEESLKEALCLTCPFRKNDCDFIHEKDDSPPCGGFIFLGKLVEEEIITIDNIKDMG